MNGSTELSAVAEERRRQVRRRVLKSGRIVFNNKASSIDCAVRNLSERGALLHVESAIGVPDNFTLVLGDGRTEECTAIFRMAKAIGAEFLKGANASAGETNGAETLPKDDLSSPTLTGMLGGSEADAALMTHAAEILDHSGDSRDEAWAAISMIHEAVGLVVPPGSLPSEEAINATYGPTFGGYAEAICEALAKLR